MQWPLSAGSRCGARRSSGTGLLTYRVLPPAFPTALPHRGPLPLESKARVSVGCLPSARRAPARQTRTLGRVTGVPGTGASLAPSLVPERRWLGGSRATAWLGGQRPLFTAPSQNGAPPENPRDGLCPGLTPAQGVFGAMPRRTPTLALQLGHQVMKMPRPSTANKLGVQGSTSMQRPQTLRLEMKSSTVSFHCSISHRERQHLRQRFCVTRGCAKGLRGPLCGEAEKPGEIPGGEERLG